jgi:hypothetical protein
MSLFIYLLNLIYFVNNAILVNTTRTIEGTQSRRYLQRKEVPTMLHNQYAHISYYYCKTHRECKSRKNCKTKNHHNSSTLHLSGLVTGSSPNKINREEAALKNTNSKACENTQTPLGITSPQRDLYYGLVTISSYWIPAGRASPYEPLPSLRRCLCQDRESAACP